MSGIRSLAKEIAALKRGQRAQSRASQAAYRSVTITDGPVLFTDETGEPVAQSAVDEETGLVVYQPLSGATPPQPTDPTATPYINGVAISWDGTFEDGNWSGGIERVDLHAVLDEFFVPATFVPSEDTQIDSFYSASGGTHYETSVPGALYQFVLVAYTTAGVQGKVSNPGEGAALFDPLYAELADLDTQLAQLDADLDTASNSLDYLTNVTLPDLQGVLDSANSDIAALYQFDAGVFPIVETDIQPGAITTPLMTANTINGDRILTNTLNAVKIVAGSITTNLFTANTINGNIVTTNTLNADRIVVGSITTNLMTANSINGDRITANTLNANKIIANSITTSQLNATAIDGMTITGAVLRTAATGERIIIRNDGSGGIIESFSGLANETAGFIDPASLSINGVARPTITIQAGTVGAQTTTGRFTVFTGNPSTNEGGGTLFEGTAHQILSGFTNGSPKSIVTVDATKVAVSAPGIQLIPDSGGDVSIRGSGVFRTDRILPYGSAPFQIGDTANSVRIISALKMGVNTVSNLATGTAASVTVNFPSPFPSSADVPVVNATLDTNAPNTFAISVRSVSRSAFICTVVRLSGSATSVNFQWAAFSAPT